MANCLAAFETEDDSLFHYNLHVQDVGHTLVVGSTGGGKSFSLNFLITCAQQYDPHTFIFDVGGSYRWLMKLLGGAFIDFRPGERPFSMNPFSLEPTAENLDFLCGFTKVLAESRGYKMNDAEQRELFSAVQSLYVLDREQRRLQTLATTVPRSLGIHLKPWTEGEQNGSWFDNVEDNVTFARTQCTDFEGMDRAGAVLEPLMFYLLHRANDVIYDESLGTVLKLGVADEAGILLKHPVTRNYFVNAMRTWRKKNAAMILSTQSLGDLCGSDDLRPIIENCPTKLLFSNPMLDEDFYRSVLRLNSVEIEKIRRLVPKRQFLMKRDSLAKVLSLNVDPKSYWLFTTNPYEAKRRQELVDQVGLEAALDILAGGSK